MQKYENAATCWAQGSMEAGAEVYGAFSGAGGRD
jgi:hypothetical protein